MFTRKHFELIAEIISKLENVDERIAMAQKHADAFTKDNPRFDREKFYAACNVTQLLAV